MELFLTRDKMHSVEWDARLSCFLCIKYIHEILSCRGNFSCAGETHISCCLIFLTMPWNGNAYLRFNRGNTVVYLCPQSKAVLIST